MKEKSELSTSKPAISFTIDSLLSKTHKSSRSHAIKFQQSYPTTDDSLESSLANFSKNYNLANRVIEFNNVPHTIGRSSQFQIIQEAPISSEASVDMSHKDMLNRQESSQEHQNKSDVSEYQSEEGKEPRFDWLQCTRYRPPKLPRKLQGS